MIADRSIVSRALRAVAFTGLFVAACSPASDSKAGGVDPGPKPDNTVRSQVCLDWQTAFCEYTVTKCNQTSAADCADVIGATFCREDSAVQGCMSALSTADCSGIPPACQNVVDKAPAVWYCRTLVNALCARGAACQMGDENQCVADASQGLNCEGAVGASSSTEACIDALPGWSCTELQGGKLPSPCLQAIKVTSGADSTTQSVPWSTVTDSAVLLVR